MPTNTKQFVSAPAQTNSSLEARNPRLLVFSSGVVWLILISVVTITAAYYILSGMVASGTKSPVMPLDDAYIHFQYSRAIAEGHPFRYNLNQPSTSGDTSLLYPFILAVGYLVGLHAEALGWWALLIGILCWVGSTALMYLIARCTHAERWLALLIAVTFALTGSLVWAFVSGMETGLLIFATLLTLWYIINEDRRGVVFAGILVALIRPEGAIIGVFAVIYMGLREKSRYMMLRRAPLYFLPVLAAMGQPILNVLLTSSATATGLQAKSYVYTVPFDMSVIKVIIGTYGQIWSQMLTGTGPNSLYYTSIPFIIAFCGVVYGVFVALAHRRLNPITLILGWLLAMTMALALLETAFWQFKRYQQPVIALFFPLVVYALVALGSYLQQRKFTQWRIVIAVVAIILLVNAGIGASTFAQNYADNVKEVANSQMSMARYVASALPADTIIGVHDIGVMRYLGDHTTYDLLGLTTQDAARAWRNGPGSAYEAMLKSQWRPTIFATYADALGLSYFSDPKTGFLGKPLANFPSVVSSEDNVASATTNGQYIYQPDWTLANSADKPHQRYSLNAITGMQLVDAVNVAELASEDAHQYRWWPDAKRSGFPSEVYNLNYVSCEGKPHECRVLDGGRLITGGEEMTIKTQPGQDLVWITRVHAHDFMKLTIYVNDAQIGTRVVPQIPGQWVEIASFVPGNKITGTKTKVRVEANLNETEAGHYMPYYHWFYQGTYQSDTTIHNPVPQTLFGQSISLVGQHLAYDPATRLVTLDLEWQSDVSVDIDAKTFVHLYDQTGKLLEGAQIDQRPGDGAVPPADWLPGLVRDSYRWQVPASAPAGTYQVAIGLYDPQQPTQRLTVAGENAGSDNRLFLGKIDVK